MTGTELRRRRQSLGWTQQQLAEALTAHGYPLARENISRWECGHYAPSGAASLLIEQVLSAAEAADQSRSTSASRPSRGVNSA